MTEKLLQINRWNETFEGANSRKLVRMRYYQAPSGNDSNGYVELMSLGAEGLAAFGVFNALCQLTATFDKPRRGTFRKSSGQPMSVSHLATLLRVQISHLENALQLLASEEVKWISWANPDECPPKTPPKRRGEEIRGEEKRGGVGETAKIEDPFRGCTLPAVLDFPDFRASWAEFQAYRTEQKFRSLKQASIRKKLIELEAMGRQGAIESINQSIANGWQGLFPPKSQNENNRSSSANGARRSFESKTDYSGIGLEA